MSCEFDKIAAVLVLTFCYRIMSKVLLLMTVLLPLCCFGSDTGYEYKDSGTGKMNKRAGEEICVSHRCLPKNYNKLELPSQHNKVNMNLEVRMFFLSPFTSFE